MCIAKCTISPATKPTLIDGVPLPERTWFNFGINCFGPITSVYKQAEDYVKKEKGEKLLTVNIERCETYYNNNKNL